MSSTRRCSGQANAERSDFLLKDELQLWKEHKSYPALSWPHNKVKQSCWVFLLKKMGGGNSRDKRFYHGSGMRSLQEKESETIEAGGRAVIIILRFTGVKWNLVNKKIPASWAVCKSARAGNCEWAKKKKKKGSRATVLPRWGCQGSQERTQQMWPWDRCDLGTGENRVLRQTISAWGGEGMKNCFVFFKFLRKGSGTDDLLAAGSYSGSVQLHPFLSWFLDLLLSL